VTARRRGPWLFSKGVDLGVFVGSFALAMGALSVGAATGVLHQETPGWAWVPAIVLCDVAHVWSTLFKTYLDPAERRARKRLFVAAPLVGMAASVALYHLGELVFWRALAYVAIFHFVRQQYGWVALYRAKAGETGGLGRAIDTAAIYAATGWPLLYWHTHVPRRFSWFVPDDVVPLPSALLPIGTALYAVALAAYAVRAVSLWARGRGNPGKDVVLVTTATSWYVGIVLFDSDYAFTVTNVLMHGVPYFAIVWTHARRQRRAGDATSTGASPLLLALTRHVLVFLVALWLIAYVEELVWDRAVWHDRAWLFGEGWDVGGAKLVIVPLLALPQLTHYVLDGFIWKRRSNAELFAAELVAAQNLR
jgi:hypothetical protein